MHLLGHLGSRAAEPERERAAPAATVAKRTAKPAAASGIAGWKVDPTPAISVAVRTPPPRAMAAHSCSLNCSPHSSRTRKESEYGSMAWRRR